MARRADPLSAVNHALQAQSLIPDVIKETGFVPTTLFSVTYPVRGEVTLGETVTKEETADEPEVTITPMLGPNPNDIAPVDESARYTLVLTDPDAPSGAEPIYRQFRHWVITGLQKPPASTSQTASSFVVKTRASTCPYRAPGPRPGSGLHRYTFLLFREPADFSGVPEGAVEYGSELEQRRSWNAVDFGEQYGMTLVGASYFLVQSE